jgi:TP901 family phage tail tape measure protein
MMASAGLNDIQAIYGTETALRVATATFGDNAAAADLIATSYNNMGDKTNDVQKEMSKLGDIITKTQQMFQIANLGQLSEGLKYGMPAAIQARMEFAELNTIIGHLNNAGLKGGMAGTAFAASMRQMNKASRELGFTIARNASGGTDFIGTLENIRKKYGDLSRASPQVQMKFQQAFGDEGLRAIILLNKQTGQMKKNLDAVRNSAGAAAEAQGRIEATELAEYLITLNNLQSLRREVGMMLMPTIKELIPEVRSLIQSFSGFLKTHPYLAKTVVLIFALAAGILSIVAPILSVAASLIIMGAYGKMTWLQLGRGLKWLANIPIKKGLIPGLKYLWMTFNKFGVISRGVLGRLATQVLMLVTRVIPALLTGIWSVTAALLANPITWVIIGVVALGAALYALYRNWDAVKQVASNVLEYLSGAVTNVLSWLSNKVAEFKQSGAALLGAFVDGLKSMIGKPAELVQSGLEKVRNLLPFSDAKEGPLSTLTKSGIAMIQTFQAGAIKALPQLQDMLRLNFEEIPFALAGASAGAGAARQIVIPELSGIFTRNKEKTDSSKGGRPILIQRLILQVSEKIEDRDAFIEMLRGIAEEVDDE